MQFILYCLCGGIGVLSDYAIFRFALYVGQGYQAANAIGYLAGTLVSFVLNRKITFGVRDKVYRRLALFLCAAGIGYLVSAALMWLFVERGGLDARLAKILTLPVVVALQFSFNRWITFRQGQKGVCE